MSFCANLCLPGAGWGRGRTPERVGARQDWGLQTDMGPPLTGMNLAQLCSSAGPLLAWLCWAAPFSAAHAQSPREPTASRSPIALDPQLLPESTSESASSAQSLCPAILLPRTPARLHNALGRAGGVQIP